mgnify:CR=1 FL=1
MSVHRSTLIFFFQAEDGIRDLVRSRGLGDVYKRQGIHALIALFVLKGGVLTPIFTGNALREKGRGAQAVSYTHLTLPTSDLV